MRIPPALLRIINGISMEFLQKLKMQLIHDLIIPFWLYIQKIMSMFTEMYIYIYSVLFHNSCVGKFQIL